ncbi:MAG TPA: hypothetical protein DCP97_04945 [Ruminococcaceae bacterium]|nr:hypothetical protein [Oscillospiraceae bacterium]
MQKNAVSTQVGKTIVCVTDQFKCERIIKAAKFLSEITKTELYVISVLTPNNQTNNLAIEHLFKISKQNGAVMTVAYSNEPEKEIISYIKNNNSINVITGMPNDKNSVLYKMWTKFTNTTFFTVSESGELQEVTKKIISSIA